ncbi:MAG TPA: PLP-dependent aminotransferase family protein [Thermoanaerobaculia bacterium]|jgi:GntR family transcriptional regulator/MocR family aminotransferase|nr:PLP-dependent aminotransferase family protein [Thermoanaerobaculia bacterium]
MTTLVTFDNRSGIPFYKQIYDGYRGAILSGRLRPGERLPSTRALAAELNVSRLPVVNAFEQLLHEGYIEGRAGSGTYVKDSIPDELARPVMAPPQRTAALLRPAPPRLGPFCVSLPALDRFPLRLWSRLVAKHAKQLTIEQMAYGDAAGHAPLRRAVADYLRTSRAVHCDASEVLIVSGSQMALQICARALLGRGGTVCIEEPGYPGAREALTGTGARIVPIPVDDEGIVVDQIGRRVRAVYVTPSHQYPLGMSMSASRRLALLEWARRGGAWIIEDDYDSEYRYASRPLGALQGMDTASRVIYIGTFSRVLFPALRLGYVVVPRDLMDSFVRHRESIDLFSPLLEQLVLTEFLTEGHFGRHVRRMRALYEKRRDALVRGLREHAGGLVPHNIDAGLHIATFLPEGVDDRKVVRDAALRGLDAIALSACYAGPRAKSGLVLGFGGTSERRIAVACRTLGEVLSAQEYPDSGRA